MQRVALACVLVFAPAVFGAPVKRRAEPDESAIQEAMSKAPLAGDRYVSGRALEHYLRARLALHDGELDAVLSELKLAVLYDPTHPFPRYALAKEYERRGDLDAADAQVKEALALEKSHVPTLVLAGRIAFARGRPEKAIDPLRRAVQADPQNVEGFALLVRALVQRRNVTGALALLDRLDGLALAASDRAASEGGRAQRLAAQALTDVAGALGPGRDAKSEELLRRAMERDPGDPAHLDRLASFFEERGRAREAAEISARGVYARGPSPAFATRATRLFLAAGDGTRARAFVEVLCGFVDGDVLGAADQAMSLGATLARARDWEDAALLFEAVGRVDPERAEAHVAAGVAAESLGQTARALANYERVEDAHPLAVQARSRALACAARSGDAKALAALEALVADNADDADSALVLASVLESMRQWSRALEVLGHAKSSLGVRRAQARLEREAGNLPNSLLILDELTRRSPPDAELEYDRALTLEAAGRRVDAMAALRKALAIEPNHVDAANVLAWLLVESKGSLPEAEELAARALAARPDDAHLLDTFGCVLLARGQVTAALAALRRAVAGAPEDAEVAGHLAAALARTGQVDEARALYGKAVRLAEARGDGATAARAAKALEALGGVSSVSP